MHKYNQNSRIHLPRKLCTLLCDGISLIKHSANVCELWNKQIGDISRNLLWHPFNEFEREFLQTLTFINLSGMFSSKLNAWNSWLKRNVKFATRFLFYFLFLIRCHKNYPSIDTIKKSSNKENCPDRFDFKSISCDNSKFKPQNCNRIVVQSRRASFDYTFTKLNAMNTNNSWPILVPCILHTDNKMSCITWALFQKVDCSKWTMKRKLCFG